MAIEKFVPVGDMFFLHFLKGTYKDAPDFVQYRLAGWAISDDGVYGLIAVLGPYQEMDPTKPLKLISVPPGTGLYVHERDLEAQLRMLREQQTKKSDV